MAKSAGVRTNNGAHLSFEADLGNELPQPGWSPTASAAGFQLITKTDLPGPHNTIHYSGPTP